MLSDDDIMLAVGKEADGLLDHIHEYGTIAEGVRQRIVALCRRAIEAAALAAQPAEPNMRHPKIQALIGGKARAEIELRLVEQLLEDPNFETTPMDMEHWGPLHDKLKAALTAQPAEPVALPNEETFTIWVEDTAADFPHVERETTYTHAEVRKMLDGISGDAALHGLEVVDNLDGTMGLRAALAQKAEPQGEVVVTKDDAGQIVAVTRQDAEGRILSVVAESAPAAAIRAGS